MIPRTLFTHEHEEYRRQVRRFFEEEIAPHHARWEDQNHVDRSIWNRAGELGHLCMSMPTEYGGSGVDRLFSVIQMEEQCRVGASGIGFSLHNDIVANYVNNFGSEEQKQRYLPKMASGEMVGAIAMTEPGTGSDLQAIKTTAISRGDHYVLNGSKIFITNGYLSDLVVVVAKTGPANGGAQAISLLLVEADSVGFTKGKPLKKVGMKAQDTCELFFNNVVVPKENLLGPEGGGFFMLMKELPWERLIIAITSVAGAEAAFEETLKYTRDRTAFGKAIASYQANRFTLAELKTKIQIGRTFIDRCLELVLQEKLDVDTAAMAKWWATDMADEVIDACVQLHGGYGYMLEYPIARMYVDARASRIYGGTNEIMKELIARQL
ncbi:MAG: acyl-CoA dehydrogenase family protein [Burkholderiales bacterium]|nr:acyl-CoA dehydrogenase family protein [Burkholderiales bacterium]